MMMATVMVIIRVALVMQVLMMIYGGVGRGYYAR
jgi:hypothetical protein